MLLSQRGTDMNEILAAWQPDTFPEYLGAAAIWTALGIALLILGYKIFDWVLRRVNFDDELRKGNIAVAIVAAAMILGIAIIIHAAIA
jgi:putative membrane protein